MCLLLLLNAEKKLADLGGGGGQFREKKREKAVTKQGDTEKVKVRQ